MKIKIVIIRNSYVTIERLIGSHDEYGDDDERVDNKQQQRTLRTSS
jgi:hypothetical protein